MKNIIIATIVSSFLFLLASVSPSVVSAQVITTSTVTTNTTTAVPAQACLDLLTNLRYGADDTNTEGSVTLLQDFLSVRGYFANIYLGTGHFGPITLSAAKQFQASQGLPTTGFVGPLTRASIKSLTCNGTITPPPTSPVSIYFLSPTSGAVGSVASITGFGFTQNNTILFDGNLVARNVPITSSIAVACTTDPSCHGGIRQTLTFTVPSSLAPNCPVGSMCPMYLRLVTPGTYNVTVQNDNGASNSVPFTVVSSSATPLSISGLDAPYSLTIGATGTWTVHTTAGIGALHYSVIWGDETTGTAQANIMMPAPTSTQNSATFTHSYQSTGTFTPTFTVTDDSGHSANVSNTLSVTPIY